MAASSKGRILCTEDDEDTRDLLVLTLSMAGYEVICTDTAAKTLDLLRNEKFDLFLMDNWMPDLSGESLCKQIREFDSKTPILFYSGAAFDSDKQRAMKAGAQGYLVKPISEGELVAEVARIIAESKIALPVAVVPPRQSKPVTPTE
jgi:DNA-binding response OmpR family regulator